MKKKKNIKIIDNFLDKKIFKRLQAFLLGADCPWFYNKSKVKSSLKPDSPIKGYESNNPHQFTHAFLRSERWSNWAENMAPLFNKINPRVWIRVKGNLSSIHAKHLVGEWHCDQHTNGVAWKDTTTSIFYINTNNGYTMFENGQKVPCLENRLAIFPNHMIHAGVSQTDTQVKVTLNLNYLNEKNKAKVKKLEK